jgi:hypothetical protein
MIDGAQSVRTRCVASTALWLIVTLWSGGALAEEPRTALRPCIDPNNLPFANLKGEGFENRIAELFAQKLGLPVKYYAFPQRMNFIRNTLRYKLPGEDFRCDVVMSVPAGYDQVSATSPYYRSTYALVFAKGKGLDGVRSGADLAALPPTCETSSGSESTTSHRRRWLLRPGWKRKRCLIRCCLRP